MLTPDESPCKKRELFSQDSDHLRGTPPSSFFQLRPACQAALKDGEDLASEDLERTHLNSAVKVKRLKEGACFLRSPLFWLS